MTSRRISNRRPCLSRPAAAMFLIAAACRGADAPAAVPPPSQTPATVIVSGRTSTAGEVKVVKVGKQLPRTFTARKLRNTPGFNWYVSRHYALKTDYQEAKARFYLTLLEMAYPHYVELFGREPPGIDDKRMAVVYGSSKEQLDKALRSDGIRWNFHGGGITFEGYRCAYQYPSGTLHYHQRYILLHECTHLFQMCLLGTIYGTRAWYHEGIADAFGGHVYDKKNRRLTVNVFDKATTANHLDRGLRQLRENPLSVREVHDRGGASRGVTFLLMHFFGDDPDRAQRFRIWRDEMFRIAPRGERRKAESARLLGELFGPWEKIEADFKRWVAAQNSTFHYAEWGWEQDGNTLWSYGFAPHGRLSQTDVNLFPARKPAYNPFRMDYPAEPMPELVGPVERGTAEPAVGCLVDFSRCPGRGCAGMGLGVIGGPRVEAFAEDVLYVDKAGKKPGVRVAAWRLGKIRGQGRNSGDVANGKCVGESVDRGIGLGLKGSITRGLRENFVLQWDGWLRIREGGVHELATASDDGSWLWIDEKLIVGNGGRHGEVAETGSVKLAAGMHRLRVRYFQGIGDRALTAGFAPKPRPGHARILVVSGKELSIDGSDLGIAGKVVTIPEPVRAAMAAGAHQIGITARIAKAALEVTLRARDPKAEAPVELKAHVPLTPAGRKALLTRPGTLLSRDGWHGVTPCFDDRRRPEPDLTRPAPPNRWRNPGDRALEGLYKAHWRLGKHAPDSLATLKAEMLAAVTGSPAKQAAALAACRNCISAVLADVRKCGADKKTIAAAVADLNRVVPSK